MRSLPLLLALAVLSLGPRLLAGRADYIVVVVWDGMRPDYGTPQDTPTLHALAARGTFFTLLHPATQFACTQDCMWWLRIVPLGPARSRLGVGFCFPRDTVARADFETGLKKYVHRWETGIAEDNRICEAQQAGLDSALRRPGPFALREPAVHRLNNWLLDQVLDGPGRPRAVGPTRSER